MDSRSNREAQRQGLADMVGSHVPVRG